MASGHAVTTAEHNRHMDHALRLAARGLGQVAPNPAVGCIIVKNGKILGRGWTAPSGRPHAETQAIEHAQNTFGVKAVEGATAYVTLEPCAHTGKTGPCAQALIAAGVTQVISACADPDPRVGGAGYQMLRDAGIDVVENVREEKARALNEGFFSRITKARPLVILKTATSLDGRIASRTGESQWITGDAARARGHLLRAKVDAIMVGSGTALHDDPSLTCRLAGLEHRSPIRVVMDGRLRLPLTSALVVSAHEHPTILITLDNADKQRIKAFEAAGIDVVCVDADTQGRPQMAQVLKALGTRGVTRLLVEGGSRLAGTLLRDGLVDRIAWFRAGSVIGDDGTAAISAFGVEKLAQMPRFELLNREKLGADLLDIWAIRA